MKRDMELVRLLLLKLEATHDATDYQPLWIDTRADREINYHLQLMAEAGLIIAKENGMGEDEEWHAKRLTWAGHEFLDAARNESIWKAAIEKVGSTVGSTSLAILTEVLKQTALRYLGLAA